MEYELIVEKDEGARIDKYLSENIQSLSRSAAAALCEEGAVTANSKPCAKNYKIRTADRIIVCVPEPKEWDHRRRGSHQQ